MAAKCNITTLVLQKLNKPIWGIDCADNTNAIVENYIEYLDCPTVNLELCYKSEQPCNNSPVIFNCNMKVTGISFQNDTVDPNNVLFSLSIGNITGATGELTYMWAFDTNDFDLIGSTTDPIIKLSPKAGKNLSSLVSMISVQVTDANNCTSIKSCYFVAGSMQCATNFVPCASPVDLVIIPVSVSCARPKDLKILPI